MSAHAGSAGVRPYPGRRGAPALSSLAEAIRKAAYTRVLKAATSTVCKQCAASRKATKRQRGSEAAIPISLPTSKSRGSTATSCAAQEQEKSVAARREGFSVRTSSVGQSESQGDAAAYLEHANKFLEVFVGPRRPLAAAPAPAHGLSYQCLIRIFKNKQQLWIFYPPLLPALDARWAPNRIHWQPFACRGGGRVQRVPHTAVWLCGRVPDARAMLVAGQPPHLRTRGGLRTRRPAPRTLSRRGYRISPYGGRATASFRVNQIQTIQTATFGRFSFFLSVFDPGAPHTGCRSSP